MLIVQKYTKKWILTDHSLSDAKVFFQELYLGGVLFVSRLEVGIHFADAFDTEGVHCFLQMLTEVGVVNVTVFVGGGVM